VDAAVIGPAKESSSDAKEVLPAIKPLKINEVIQINIARFIVFPPFLENHKEATIMPASVGTIFQSLKEIQ
jgi:hypothetical protein